MKKLVINKTDLCWLCLGLFWILENLAPHSTASQIAMVIMLAGVGIYCVQHKKIMISPVLISYSLLILLQLLYVIIGEVAKESVTINNLETMLICLLCGIVIYTFLYNAGDMDSIGTFFIYTGIISLVIVMFLCRGSLLTGRMAHAYGEGAVSYYFLGKPVAISSNGIATYSCFGFFFALIKYTKDKKMRWLLYSGIFIIGVVLTGSRKGILMLGAYWAIYEIIIKKNKALVLKIFGMIVALIVGYMAITKIPVFRSIIGERLEDLFLKMFTGATVTEGSMTARARYATYAREIISQEYIFGKGLGWFKSVYGNVTENNYFELIVGCGIGGLVLNYSFVISVLKKLQRFRYDKMCVAMSLVLAVLLIMEWGSVVYLSRDTLIYESLFFIAVKYANVQKNRNEVTIN